VCRALDPGAQGGSAPSPALSHLHGRHLARVAPADAPAEEQGSDERADLEDEQLGHPHGVERGLGGGDRGVQHVAHFHVDHPHVQGVHRLLPREHLNQRLDFPLHDRQDFVRDVHAPQDVGREHGDGEARRQERQQDERQRVEEVVQDFAEEALVGVFAEDGRVLDGPAVFGHVVVGCPALERDSTASCVVGGVVAAVGGSFDSSVRDRRVAHDHLHDLRFVRD